MPEHSLQPPRLGAESRLPHTEGLEQGWLLPSRVSLEGELMEAVWELLTPKQVELEDGLVYQVAPGQQRQLSCFWR